MRDDGLQRRAGEPSLNPCALPDADVVIVSTDARSKTLIDALTATESTVRWLLTLQPVVIYKKIDSLLRGAVIFSGRCYHCMRFL